MSVSIRPPKVKRQKGRPTAAQKIVEFALKMSVKDFQEWQLATNKVATGKSINGWVITLTRTKLGLATTGVITNTATYVNEMLFGRGPGKAPPVEAIRKWIQAKGVQSSTYSLRDLSYLIARKIGREGTNPPVLTRNIRTKMVQFNTRAILAKSAPLWRATAANDFLTSISNILTETNKKTKGINISTSLDEDGDPVKDFDLKLGKNLFNYRYKLENRK